MKTIKKSIFAALILAVMGILITKAVSNTTVNELLDLNTEALALEDPDNPSRPDLGYQGGGGGSGPVHVYCITTPESGKPVELMVCGSNGCKKKTTPPGILDTTTDKCGK